MIGISDIASYIPGNRISNLDRCEALGADKAFVSNKIGIFSVARKAVHEETSDLCCAAFERLRQRGRVEPSRIQAVVVCTQNPDYSLPHTSAIVHGKLGLPEQCAAFDISLGCSGYVYGLAVIEGFMKGAGLAHGLLFTADPYSKIIDENDKNTSLLFGDAATVTYVAESPVFATGRSTFGTRGKGYEGLICRDKTLSMNGRAIFNFAASTVPDDVRNSLAMNGLSIGDIDRFLIHQGSKYIVEFLSKALELPPEKTPFECAEYGNTVSSSLPLMLENVLGDASIRRVLMTGFGVGLSWATTVLFRQ